MKKGLKITILLLLIFSLIIGFVFAIKNYTGKIVQDSEFESNNFSDKYHIYTKAICNDSNYCQDNEVTCNNNIVVSVKPISGAVVQFSENWKDFRMNEKLC